LIVAMIFLDITKTSSVKTVGFGGAMQGRKFFLELVSGSGSAGW